MPDFTASQQLKSEHPVIAMCRNYRLRLATHRFLLGSEINLLVRSVIHHYAMTLPIRRVRSKSRRVISQDLLIALNVNAQEKM